MCVVVDKLGPETEVTTCTFFFFFFFFNITFSYRKAVEYVKIIGHRTQTKRFAKQKG